MILNNGVESIHSIIILLYDIRYTITIEHWTSPDNGTFLEIIITIFIWYYYLETSTWVQQWFNPKQYYINVQAAE